MLKYGQINHLKVAKTVDFGVYLDGGDENILLPRNSMPPECKVGDEVEVFIYFDSEDRVIASTRIPRAACGSFSLLKCVENNQLGAFCDWGLEKDLFVPFRHQTERMRAGHSYVVTVLYDEVSKRLIGSDLFDKILHGDPTEVELETPLESIVYAQTDQGYRCIVAKKHLGMLYKSECPTLLKIGDRPTVFATKLRPDGKFDLRSRAAGIGGILSEQQRVIDELKRFGFIPYTAQTPPEEIKQRFRMSKRLFKGVIGTLYKQRLIKLDEDGIRLA